MTTENRAVTIYLPIELEEKIKQYCLDKDIVRRNKKGDVIPSLGIGILEYLKGEFITGDLIEVNQENKELKEKVN